MTAFNLIPVIAFLLAALIVNQFANSPFIKSPSRSIRCAVLAAGSNFLMLAGLPFGDPHIASGFLFAGLFFFVFFGTLSTAHVDDEPRKRLRRERGVYPVGWQNLCLQAVPVRARR